MSLQHGLQRWIAEARRRDQAPKQGWRRVGALALRLAVVVLVTWGIGRHVAKLLGQGAEVESLDFGASWAVTSLVAYIAGMSLAGVYFRHVLRKLGARPSLGRALAVYWVSQLGKYVPGKALVLVMRCGLLYAHGVARSATAVASLYETPMTMAVGSAVAFVLILAAGPSAVGHHETLLLVSGALAAGLGLSVMPPVFARIADVVTKPFRGNGEEPPRIGARTALFGAVLLVPAWALVGLSVIACVEAVSRSPVPPELWPALVAAAGVGMAAGFVVLVAPGGLGVREWVIVEALAPAIGSERALCAALALRLTWVIGELVAGAVLTVVVEAWERQKKRPRS